MILRINKEPSLDDDCVDVHYRELTPAIKQILSICKEGTQMLRAEQNGKVFNIDTNDIFYIEWIDNRSCICASKEIYSTPQTLSQLDQLLDSKSFVRVSKPMIVNVYKVKWVSSGFNMKLSAELINGERIEISRHYRDQLLDAIYGLGKEK